MKIHTVITRRSALMAVLAMPGFAVTSCSFIGNLPQYAQTAQNLAGALGKVADVIGTVSGVSAATVEKAKSLIAKIGAVASDIATATGQALTGAATDFAATFNNLTATLGLNMPGIVGTVLQAGIAVLPKILAAAGVLIPLAGPRSSIYTAEQAEAILAGIARS